ncbi:TIGR02281 family clan AA aspartic protease [uncultured Planktomarina sp.]|jgi:aspartyl protease family protein|uniref:retropepsin-like aspartic protease family protein n=1 Tax=uncultured Planktomarina sp. TaxID=1538529 RepID=UPI00326027C9
MSGESLASLGYLALLLVALGGAYLASHRQSVGKSLQMALVWGMIFLGCMAVYGLWGDISRDYGRNSLPITQQDGTIALPRAPDGHYYVTAEVNGAAIDFLVDTGASDIVLSRADAARIGFDLEKLAFLGSARTANGIVPIAYSRLKTIQLGPYLDQGVSVAINGGEMEKSLLGMSYLGLFGRIEIAQDQLILRR